MVQSSATVEEARPGADGTARHQPSGATPRTSHSWAMALVGLAVGVGFLVVDAMSNRLYTDVFWQLAAGQWMLAHHAVIGLDPFSYTEAHHRWVADEWGSEVALAALYKVFGVAAYNIFAIVTGTLSLICTMAYARALGARGGRLAAIVILLALGIGGFVVQDRGLSFSLIWLPLELLILTKARKSPRWLWALPVLCVFWVNTHGSILVGLFVLGVELMWSLAPARLAARVGGVGRSPFPKALALAGVGSALASCISPYGPGLLGYDLSVARNTQIAKYIQEWRSPDFHSVINLVLIGVPVLVLIFALRRRRIMLLEATLTAAFLLGTLHSIRILIYLLVAAAGLAATLPARPEWSARARRVMCAGAVGVMVAMLAIPSVPAGSVSTSTPVQAFNFLADHPGRIFTQYEWGDYSIARHRATFVDGRTDLFSGRVLSEFFAINAGTTDPDPILARNHVDYVVWAPNSPLGVFLAHDARWVVVDRTPQAVVFARRATWTG